MIGVVHKGPHTVDDLCTSCGHVIGSQCSQCGREMLCGRLGEPCPAPGCLELVFPDRNNDLQPETPNFEPPRQVQP